MIQISTDENDIVLDPFAGSGTVLSQSAYMKRNYIGFELNKKYIEMFKSYITKTFETGRLEYEKFNNSPSQDQFEKTILELRALKFARVLLTSIQNATSFKQFKIIVEIDQKSELSNKLIKVIYKFIGDYDKDTFLDIINKNTIIPPLSKFGIEPSFIFQDIEELDTNGYYGYTQTNTHSFVKDIALSSTKVRVLSKICVDINEKDYL